MRACRAARVALLDVTDEVDAGDIERGGECEVGCVRRYSAVAAASGEIDCDLRVLNMLDHTTNDVAGGALNVVHSCTDADGSPKYEVGEGRGGVCDGKRVAETEQIIPIEM